MTPLRFCAPCSPPKRTPCRLDGRSTKPLVSMLRDHTDADSVLERELAEAGAARAAEAGADIERALRRIELGTYGSCERCHAAIPVERLEVIPSARLCVACPAIPRGFRR